MNISLPSGNKTEPKIETAKENERDYITRLLHVAKGNIFEAVRLSGLGRATIYRKIAQYKITRPN